MKSKKLKIYGYSGGKLFLNAFPDGIVLAFDGITIHQDTIPTLWAHNHDKVLGQINTAQIKKEGLILTGQLWLATMLSKIIVDYDTAGHNWRASVGADPTKYEWIDPGETFEANGQKFEGPCCYAHKWELKEISILPIPADSNTKVLIG